MRPAQFYAPAIFVYFPSNKKIIGATQWQKLNAKAGTETRPYAVPKVSQLLRNPNEKRIWSWPIILGGGAHDENRYRAKLHLRCIKYTAVNGAPANRMFDL